jgi:hypothetical protein
VRDCRTGSDAAGGESIPINEQGLWDSDDDDLFPSSAGSVHGTTEGESITFQAPLEVSAVGGNEGTLEPSPQNFAFCRHQLIEICPMALADRRSYSTVRIERKYGRVPYQIAYTLAAGEHCRSSSRRRWTIHEVPIALPVTSLCPKLWTTHPLEL